MTDPLAVLNLPQGSDDEAIRRRYLELVREFPPEQAPERFSEIRAAYDALKDPVAQLRRRLFKPYAGDPLEATIAEAERQTPRKRLNLTALVDALRARE